MQNVINLVVSVPHVSGVSFVAHAVAKDFFKRYDDNNDGTLQKKQLLNALHAFGFDLDKEGVDFLKQHFDMDGMTSLSLSHAPVVWCRRGDNDEG